MAPHATTKREKQEWITFLKMPEEEDHYCVYTTWFESSPGHDLQSYNDQTLPL